MKTGTLVRWIAARGFGFIQQPDGTTMFVHVRAFQPGTEPAVGDRIEFEIGIDPERHKERAVNARIVASAAGGAI